MEEKLCEIVCEAFQSDACMRGCNYGYCHQVMTVVDKLIENGVIISE